MSLIHRIARLFKADLHGILDSLEEPDIMLKQAVREMQEEIGHSETQLKALNKQVEQLLTATRDLACKLPAIEAQIDFCFATANEALAKTLLRKKLEAQQSLRRLEKRHQTLQDEKTAVEAELAARRDKLNSVVEQMALFDVTSNPDEATENTSQNSQAVSQEDVELAYLQEKQRRGQTKEEQKP
jgi:phage shock protein A